MGLAKSPLYCGLTIYHRLNYNFVLERLNTLTTSLRSGAVFMMSQRAWKTPRRVAALSYGVSWICQTRPLPPRLESRSRIGIQRPVWRPKAQCSWPGHYLESHLSSWAYCWPPAMATQAVSRRLKRYCKHSATAWRPLHVSSETLMQTSLWQAMQYILCFLLSLLPS